MVGEEENIEEALQDWGSINRQTESVLLSQDTFRNNDESLPKRSGKFFDRDGSEVQKLKLDDARDQMYLALRHIRGHHAKQLLVGVWVQSKKKAFIPHAKGSFFKDMGMPHAYKLKKKIQGLWLSEIEAVYLVERGSLVMYLSNDQFLGFIEDDNLLFDYETLTHLTLAHLYALAFNMEPDLLDKYQVFSLLKRLGYSVMECRDYRSQDDVCDLPQETGKENTWSFINRVRFGILNLGTTTRKLCMPLLQNRNHFFDFTLVFQSLRLAPFCIPAEASKPPHIVDPRYRIVFNVWKPTASFSKRNPPRPDFNVGVLNTSKVPFPDIFSIRSSWDQPFFELKNKTHEGDKKPVVNHKAKKNLPMSKKELSLKRKAERDSKLNPIIRNRNNYLRARDMLFKRGSTGRSTVFAIIDNGIVNFTTFNETDFTLSSCTDDLNKLESRKDHGIVWNEKLEI